MSAVVLDRRALNRATMARQLLLDRAAMAPLDAVEHLVGLQAQEPRDPYVALWSRLDAFDPDALSSDVEEHRAVRIAVMRGTIHLLSADDALVLRPLTQPVLAAEIARHGEYSLPLRGVDVEPIMAFVARRLAADGPMTTTAIRALVGEEFPELHAPALAYAARCLLPLVQVPPRGLWRTSGQVRLTTTDAWIGRPLARKPRLEDAIVRYLAAFGPALPADVTAWCRLTGIRDVLDGMRSRLRVLRDERGRELFDVPDAPLPDPDTPAPVRFLPEYDNALLSYGDRSRFTPDDAALLATDTRVHGTVLVDGMVAGTWSEERGTASPSITVRHLPSVGKQARAELAAEGNRLAAFLARGEHPPDVRLVAVG